MQIKVGECLDKTNNQVFSHSSKIRFFLGTFKGIKSIHFVKNQSQTMSCIIAPENGSYTISF